MLQEVLLFCGGQSMGGEHGTERFFPKCPQRRGRQHSAARSGLLCIGQLKRMKSGGLLLPVNVHERKRLFPDRIGAFLVIAQSLPTLGQLIASPLMRSGDTLAGESRTAGNIEEMAIDIVLHALEIAWRDLPCHIQWDPPLQSQHQLMKGSVQIVYYIQVQSFFQKRGKTEHILFRKVPVLRHVVHWHIAAQEDRRI